MIAPLTFNNIALGVGSGVVGGAKGPRPILGLKTVHPAVLFALRVPDRALLVVLNSTQGIQSNDTKELINLDFAMPIKKCKQCIGIIFYIFI